MAELLLFVADRSDPDPKVDCRIFKRGHVVDVRPDGWKWGRDELALDIFRIVRVPALLASKALALLAQQVGDPSKDPLLKHRAVRLRLDDLPIASRSRLTGARIDAIIDMTADRIDAIWQQDAAV